MKLVFWSKNCKKEIENFVDVRICLFYWIDYDFLIILYFKNFIFILIN